MMRHAFQCRAGWVICHRVFWIVVFNSLNQSATRQFAKGVTFVNRTLSDEELRAALPIKKSP